MAHIDRQIGRILFALGMAALGVLSLKHADFILEWSAVPADLPQHVNLAYAQGALLVACAVGLFIPATTRLAAYLLAALWLVYALLHVPGLMADWKTGLGSQFEAVAMTCMCLLLTGDDGVMRIARYGFGASMIPFGIVHFLYADPIAQYWIPHWIPGLAPQTWSPIATPLHLSTDPRAVWAYATGLAHIAGGLAVLSGVLAGFASQLVVVMYGSWLIMLHIPRVMATPDDRHEWTTLCVACAFNGGAWLLAGYLAQRRAT